MLLLLLLLLLPPTWFLAPVLRGHIDNGSDDCCTVDGEASARCLLYYYIPGALLNSSLVYASLRTPDIRVIAASTCASSAEVVVDHLPTGIRVRLWSEPFDAMLYFECHATSWFGGRHAGRRAHTALNAVLDYFTSSLSGWTGFGYDRYEAVRCEHTLRAKIAQSNWATVVPGRLRDEVAVRLRRKSLLSRPRCFADSNSSYVPETVVVRDCPERMRMPVLYLLAPAHITRRYTTSHVNMAFRELSRISSSSFFSVSSATVQVLWSDTPWSRELYRSLTMVLGLNVSSRRPCRPTVLLVYFRRSDFPSTDDDDDRRLQEITALDFTFPPTAVT